MSDALIYFLIAQFGLILGYVCGRISSTQEVIKTSNSTGRTEKAVAKMNAVKIDEKTYVTNVVSDSFTKSHSSLGKNSIVEDNIDASVNKLAQLKRGK
jgi:hypothetical protein